MRTVVTSFLAIVLFSATQITAALSGPIEDAAQAYSSADYDTAVDIVEPLANQGNADAQYILGMAYMDGNGVGQDLVESYKWFELVVRSGDSSAELDRDDVAAQLKPDQLAEAKKRVDAWMPQ